MPDASCRNCGDDLVKYSLCAECKQVTQKICKTCGARTDEQFHENCFCMFDSIESQMKPCMGEIFG